MKKIIHNSKSAPCAIFFFFLVFVSCAEGIDTSVVAEQEELVSVDTLELTEEVAQEERGPVSLDQYISFFLPNEYGIELDSPLDFEHSQLVGFYRDSGMVFRIADLLITPRMDEMIDAEGEMSLSHIVCEDSGEIPNIILQGVYRLNDRFIPYYPNAKSRLLPGQSMTLGGYTFKAFGLIEEDGSTISDYEIIMEGERNGQLIEQRIVFIEYFDDTFVEFHWIADLDMDGIPDFLIDLSPKYSYSLPTLFLSSNAGFGELVKDVHEEAVFGC